MLKGLGTYNSKQEPCWVPGRHQPFRWERTPCWIPPPPPPLFFRPPQWGYLPRGGGGGAAHRSGLKYPARSFWRDQGARSRQGGGTPLGGPPPPPPSYAGFQQLRSIPRGGGRGQAISFPGKEHRPSENRKRDGSGPSPV